MGNVTLRNTKGSPLTYTEVDNNFKACDADKNLIINGAMDIWQRGTSFTGIGTTATYGPDRFKDVKVTTSAISSLTQSGSILPTAAQAGVVPNFSLLVEPTTSDITVGSTDQWAIQYTVEGYDYAQVEGNTYTLSFWVRSTKTGTYCIGLVNTGGDRSYVAEYTIDFANTWEKKTISITFDYTAGGTWSYTSGAGLKIFFTLMAGSTYQTTAGTWQSGNFIATSNQVNFADNVANDIYFTLVKFEPGPEATAFRKRPFAEELKLCQRYYQKTYGSSTAPGASSSTGVFSGRARGTESLEGLTFNWRFTIPMRVTPTVTLYNPSLGTLNQFRNLSGGADVNATALEVSNTSASLVNNGAITSGNIYSVHATAAADF